jgi:hypothetical protein
VLFDGIHRLVPAVADRHVEPVALQDFLKAEENVRVVFNDKAAVINNGSIRGRDRI